MKKIKLLEQFLLEKKPKGAPDWHDSDAPDAEGRFKDLGIKDLASWLIKTRDKDLKKITGSLNQQIVFNRNDDPEYADKMEKTRKEVYKQLGRQDLIDAMKESVEITESHFKVGDKVKMSHGGTGVIASLDKENGTEDEKYYNVKLPNGDIHKHSPSELTKESVKVNEKVKVFMKNILSKMIPAAFGSSNNSKMKDEMKDAIAAAIEPILQKYDYIVEEEGRDTLAELDEMTLGQLERIEDYAEMIEERMESGQKLKSWMYSQITIALENLNAVHDALAGEEEEEVDEDRDWNDKRRGPHPYTATLSPEDEEKKEAQMKKQAAMDDDDPVAYKEMPGSEEARKKGKVKTSKHVKKYHQLYGDDKNEAYLNEKAEGDRGPIDDDAIETGLKNKSEETGVPIQLLRIVMRRGMAAWKTGHRPGATQQQWGYARVNSFLTKQPGTWGGADSDVAKEVRDGGHDKDLKS